MRDGAMLILVQSLMLESRRERDVMFDFLGLFSHEYDLRAGVLAVSFGSGRVSDFDYYGAGGIPLSELRVMKSLLLPLLEERPVWALERSRDPSQSQKPGYAPVRPRSRRGCRHT